jgi:hypothetical protein
VATVGSTTLTFGAFPGGPVASVAVTGQSSILTTSHCEGFLDPTQPDTSDHSSDEHVLSAPEIEVVCQAIVAGTGFTIVAKAANNNVYGSYNVSWVWV